MSDEATIHCSLQITKDSLEYRSYPSAFQADVATAKGPSPGAFTASYTGTGTQVSFTNLSTPALAIVRNLDDTNYVELGVVVSGTFYSLLEIQAGEFYPYRFGRNMTKTIIYIRANTADCDVSVEAFEA
jgi:hypothetical protein